MKEKIWFSELQKFRLWHGILLLAAISIPIVILLMSVIAQVKNGNPVDDGSMNNDELLTLFGIVFCLSLIPVLLFFRVKLETVITEKEIGVRYYPFRRSFQYFRWEDIATAEVQRYHPFLQGGFGMRRKFRGGFNIGITGLRLGAFNKKNILYLGGKYALILQFNEGGKLLIGTQMKNELELALYKVQQIKKENQSNLM
jgi:hypothetical protein